MRTLNRFEQQMSQLDYLEFLSSLPDNHVDCIITDPPYKVTKLGYDKDLMDFEGFWREIERVRKPHAPVVIFSAQPFTHFLMRSNLKRFHYEIIWVKTRKTGGTNSSWRPLQQHENILVFYGYKGNRYNPQMGEGIPKGIVKRQVSSKHYGAYKPSIYVNTGERHPTTVLHFDSPKRFRGSHPSLKPLELIEYLVKQYSNPGDLVLDPFAGSGVLGAACVNLKRFYLLNDNGSWRL